MPGDCGEKFGQKYNLLKHIKKFHKNIENFRTFFEFCRGKAKVAEIESPKKYQAVCR
jgi:hypothetical protein